jgi:prolyl-tRNA synthetase
MSGKTAIQPTREQDYPQWYQNVVRDAELAEMAHVRGCMVIKPWGYGIWECIQRRLDRRIKETGHHNAYFPLLIPLEYIAKEAEHVEGFAKEMAVVTHHRLEKKDGRLVPSAAAELESPLIVRPTSETIIGESMAKWIQSYRDLPLKLNQWANIVRWELRPRVFLRTTEFLWQEGHTAHATAAEADEETRLMLEIYREVVEEWLAMPVIQGEKPASERFPGAEHTYCIEAMMQDLKALQAGTSHDLGQNFARAANIKFLDGAGEEQFVHTTSWGVSTRLVGGVVMTHGDDNGLRLPPRIAPYQVVVVPIYRDDSERDEVMGFVESLTARLNRCTFAGGEPVRAFLDASLYRSVEKKWTWIKRGVPLLLEIGPRDLANGNVSFLDRTKTPRDVQRMPVDEFVDKVGEILDGIQGTLFEEALERQRANLRTDVEDFDAFEKHFGDREARAAFVNAKWCEGGTCEEKLKALAVSIRVLPFEQSATSGRCVLCGEDATVDAVFARAY